MGIDVTSPLTADILSEPVQFLKGCGPERAALLARLELTTVHDMLWYLPRDVLDLSDVCEVQKLTSDSVHTVRGEVADMEGRQIAGGRSLSAVLLNCDGQFVRGLWFNQTWILQKFRPGQIVLFSGKPKKHAGRWEFSHPRVQYLDEDDPNATGGILCRYGLTDGLKMWEIRRIIRDAVERCAEAVPERLPESFRSANNLPQIGEALRQLHLPKSMDEYNAGRRRLLFDDLLDFQIALAVRRRMWKTHDDAPKLPTTAKIDARIRRLFPFTFTDGQNQAVRAISADLASGKAMHRLLQADVGAGKTAVAVYGMLVAVAAGYQTVMMAPTEVLANQHWEMIDAALRDSRVNRRLLTGSLTAAQRRKTLDEITRGEVSLVVGTQAVIQQGVKFAKLGLAVIDEQHKFGVEQRAHFSMTGAAVSPHVLVMTATPIPRSLCLTQFGDLDITIVKDLPPGRQKIVTGRITGTAARDRAWEFLRKQLRAGRQAYVVCPRIEEKVEDSAAYVTPSAEQVFRQLSTGELKDFRVALIHGQMDRVQKSEVMESFRSGETQVLVSTTVIEVGVDVPNATLMVIMQAERFGLSQLHQLRGRVGRGKFQGYCFLFSEADSAEAVKRLHVLESTTDGFEIAEADFEIRGPGDVLGTKQHGDLPLKVANIVRDRDLLIEARDAAFQLVDSGEIDQPEFLPVKVDILDRFGRLMDLPQSG